MIIVLIGSALAGLALALFRIRVWGLAATAALAIVAAIAAKPMIGSLIPIFGADQLLAGIAVQVFYFVGEFLKSMLLYQKAKRPTARAY